MDRRRHSESSGVGDTHQEQSDLGAVSEGVHAGYVDQEDLAYNVSITNMEGDVVFQTSTKATEVEYTLGESSDLSLYTAYVSASSKGLTGMSANSAGVVMGDAITPPATFEPTYEEYSLMTQFDKNGDGSCWSFNSNRGDALLSGYTMGPAQWTTISSFPP